MGVTTVLRGEDHVSNTAAQIQMFTALGAPVPGFAHEALLVGKEGKLSKRLGSLGVAAFRERGIEPMAVNAMLARLGTSDPVEPFTEMAPLLDSFDFARFGRAPARFDEDELALLNQKIVHQMPYDAVKHRLPEGMTEAAWHVLSPNLSTVADAAGWWTLVTGPIDAPALSDDDKVFVATAHGTLSAMPWDEGIWKSLTGALKETTGRKGKGLFLPLRLALTGMEHGPDMGELLPLIGRDAALERLSAAV
jgi:glutamyl-tRNA synthetase